MLVDLRDRILSQGGIPDLPDGLARSSPRCARPAARRSPATSWSTRAAPRTGSRSPSSTSPARARRPAPARCCSPARSAACSARCRPASSCPPPTTTCSARTGTRASPPPSTSRLDLSTGDFEVRTAGHPPAAQRAAGSGRWTVHRRRGPGARPDRGRRVHRASRGMLRRGDAMLLYTDGLVETPSRDIGLGHRPDARPGRAAAARRVRGRRPAADRRRSARRTTTGRCCWCTAASRQRGSRAIASVGAGGARVWHHDTRDISAGPRGRRLCADVAQW